MSLKVMFTAGIIMCGLLAFGQSDHPDGHRKQTNSFGTSGGNARDSAQSKCCSGTLGALLTDGTTKYVLSNNHVLGLLGAATPGDPITQPGLIDSNCMVPRTVAKFTAAADLKSNVDAAIAELLPSTMDSDGDILALGVPSGAIAAPVPNLNVVKSGRSSGLTEGSILSVATDMKVDYSRGCKAQISKPVAFHDLIVVQGKDQPFSAGGDSGSLIVTRDSHQPVALLFAGSSTLTLGNPIGDVLTELSKVLGGKQLTFVQSVAAQNRFLKNPQSKQARNTSLDNSQASSKSTSAAIATDASAASSKSQKSKKKAKVSDTRTPSPVKIPIRSSSAPISLAFSAQSEDSLSEPVKAAKKDLSSKLLQDPAVLGVGASPGERGEVLVFVEKGSASSAVLESGMVFSAQDEATYQGVKTRIIETDPFTAFGWNEQATTDHCVRK